MVQQREDRELARIAVVPGSPMGPTLGTLGPRQQRETGSPCRSEPAAAPRRPEPSEQKTCRETSRALKDFQTKVLDDVYVRVRTVAGVDAWITRLTPSSAGSRKHT